MKVTLLTNFSGTNSDIKISGLERYTLSLYEKIRKSGDAVVRKETEGIPYWLAKIGLFFGKDLQTIVKRTPLLFPAEQDKQGKQLLHCTSQTLALPLLYQKRTCVVTVHDLIPVATKTYKNFTEKVLWFFILRALKKATHIIADSEHTKKDIIKYVGYDNAKITVIPLGVDTARFYDKKKRRTENTILYVGSDAQRKNIELIVKALVHVKKAVPNISFVKVGQAQDQNMRKRLVALVKNLGLEENVIWKDYVEDVAEEYNTATVFVFPSLYEGFGFPILEAMACGCPVITTNMTSLPEVAGDAAAYCDGYCEVELANKIIHVLNDKKAQSQIRTKGFLQARKFTWQKCAEETVKIYKKYS